MPPRLLGIGMRAVSPELITEAAERERLAHFSAAYKAWKNENIDQLTLTGVMLADTAEAVLTNVADPKDADATKAFLESTPVKSVQTIRFSKTSHIGLGANDVAILEFKQGRWVKADPLK
jgi:hypothetical protein